MSILALSTGIELGLITELAKHDKVYLFADYISPFPEFEELAIGRNLPNIEPITTLDIELKQISKVVAFDCYFGFIIELFKRLNIPTFGAGNEAELENNRKLQKQLIPNPSPYEETTFDNLKPGKVIKVNPIYRGSFETAVVRTQAELDFFKEMLKRNGGPLAEEITYFEEDVLDIEFEIGIDTVCLGNGLEFPLFFGIEQSKSTYMAVVISDWESLSRFPLYKNTFALHEVLKKYGYKGFFSTEEIVTKSRPSESYLIDICMRAPFPLGCSYPKFYNNFANIVLKEKKPRIDAKFVVSIPLTTRLANDYFVPAIFKDQTMFNKYITLQTFYKPKKQPRNAILLYYIKGYSNIGTVTLLYNEIPPADRILEDYNKVVQTIEIPDLVDETGTIAENYESFIQALNFYGYNTKNKTQIFINQPEESFRPAIKAKDVLKLLEMR